MLDAFFLNIDPEPFYDPFEQPEVTMELRGLLRYLNRCNA